MSDNGKKTVLLFHGLGGGPAELIYLKLRLEGSGYSVVTPTLPGHGTRLGDLKSLTWKDFTNFVEKEFIKLKSAGHEVVVGGNCMGAILGLWLASRFPNDVSGVLPISTTLFFDGWGLNRFAKYLTLFRFSPAYYFSNVEVTKFLGIKDEGIREWVKSGRESKAATVSYYPRIPLSSIWELELLCRQVRNSVRAIRKPVHVIHANEDEVTSMRSVDCIRTQLNPLLYSELILKNSYHLVTIDKERAVVANSAISFLDRIFHVELNSAFAEKLKAG